MAAFIKEMPRFKKDCEYYTSIIEKMPIGANKQKLESIYTDFLLKVEAVDSSVHDMATGMVAVGLQHGTYVEELKKVRLRLDSEIKKVAKNVLDKK